MSIRILAACLVVVGGVALSGYAADELAQEIEEDTAAALAEDETSTVKVTLWSGKLEAGLSYHSNPYYRGEGTASEGVVLAIDPGIRIDIPVNEMLYFGLDGKVDLTHVFFTSDSVDDDKTVAHPFVRGKARYNLSEFSSFSLADEFQTANVDDVGDSARFYQNKAQVEGATVLGGMIDLKGWFRNVLVEQNDEALLFNSQENVAGLDVSVPVAYSSDGRPVTIGLVGSYGRKSFEDGDFAVLLSDNPKSHDYYTVGGRVALPVSSLLTLYARCGWKFREYDATADDSDDSTDSVYGGLNATLIPTPGSPLSFTLSGSHETTDTLVYDIETYDSSVFEATDALLNTLSITYRELEVSRVGLVMDYKVNDRVALAFSGVYQYTTADAEDDLAALSGNVDPHGDGEFVGRSTSQDQVTVGGMVSYQATETLSLNLGYQHGFSTDSDASASEDEDLYEYDSVGLLARMRFF